MRLIAILLCCALLSGCAGLRANVRHHPVIWGAAVGAGISLTVYGLTGPHSCSKHIDGYPYDGTPPCPTWCDKDGCYWPSK